MSPNKIEEEEDRTGRFKQPQRPESHYITGQPRRPIDFSRMETPLAFLNNHLSPHALNVTSHDLTMLPQMQTITTEFEQIHLYARNRQQQIN